MRYRSLKYVYLAAALLFIGNLFGSCIVFFEINDTTHFYLVNPLSYLTFSKNTTCYKERSENTLNILNADFFPRQSIFFHSTSCDRMLDDYGACAIESAARLNPEVQINLMYTSPVSRSTWNNIFDYFIKLNNFNLVGIHVESYADGTTFENFWKNVVDNSKIVDCKQIAEYLKFLTLHKHGGTVIDLDVIVTKPLIDLGDNWVVIGRDNMLTTDIVSISRDYLDRNITEMILSSLTQQIIEGRINGSVAITNAFKNVCSENDFGNKISKTCYDFEIYKDKMYQNIISSNWQHYFQLVNSDDANNIWDMAHSKKDTSLQSLYADIAQKYCPWVYSRIFNY